MAVTDPDAYADRAAARATPAATPAPAPPGSTAPPPAASTPSPAAPPAAATGTTAMDEAAFQGFARAHGGILSMDVDPKDAEIEVEQVKPGPGPESTRDTVKVKKPNPNPRVVVVFNDKTSMVVQRPRGGGGSQSGYTIVDPGTAHEPTKAQNAGKTPEQIAAESKAGVEQSGASAEASRASAEASRAGARNANAQAESQEAQNRGELTPAQKQAAAQKERDQKLSEIEKQMTAQQIDLETAKAQATAAYQEYNGKIALHNAELAERTGASNERNADVGVARDVAQMTTSAVNAARPYMMSDEDAANLADSQNRRLAAAGIQGTVRQSTSKIPFDPESIARRAMAKVLGGQYGTTDDNPLPGRTSFAMTPVGAPPAAGGFAPGTAAQDATRAAIAGPPPTAGPPPRESVTGDADRGLGNVVPGYVPGSGVPPVAAANPAVDDPRAAASFPPPGQASGAPPSPLDQAAVQANETPPPMASGALAPQLPPSPTGFGLTGAPPVGDGRALPSAATMRPDEIKAYLARLALQGRPG